jgi:hypothetical protein
MFILGMLAVLQITFLPGILLYKAFRIQKEIINSLVFTFGLSLIANYCGVFLLTTLGIYTSIVVYIIFLIEIGLVLWLYRDTLLSSLGNLGITVVKRITTYFSYFEIKNPKDNPKQAVVNLLVGGIFIFFIIMAFSSLWWITKFWWNNLGSVFTMWDPVVSWNRMANVWFQNRIPLLTYLYPQLMPINFSIPYIFLGSSQIQLFTTGYMPLFSIFILLIMLDLGLRYRRVGYFIGLVITRFILKKFYFLQIGEGYLDLPVAFFSLVSIYCLLIAEKEKRKDVMSHYLLLGAIFSAGVSITKQSGLYIFALYPILAYFIVVRKYEGMEIKEKVKLVLVPSLVLLLMVLPGYIFAEINILSGVNKYDSGFIFDENVHGGLDYLGRIPVAFASLEKYAYLYLILALMLPMLSNTYRWIALTIVFPYTLIWSMLFSYSHRNLSLAIPFLGLTVGVGLEKSLNLFKEFISRIHIYRLKVVIIPIILVLVVLGLGLYFTDSFLVDQQIEEQRDIIFPSLNKKLYGFFPEGGPYDKIITRYPIHYLPGFENSEIPFRFETYSGYISIKEEYPDVKFLLIEKKADDQIIEELYRNVEMGNYKLIFEDHGYLFFQILTEE